MPSLKKHGTYTNKKMWRADIGELQFEAIQKGKEKNVRVDLYRYPAGDEYFTKESTGMFIVSKDFGSFDEADKFVSQFQPIDFSLALERIRGSKCPVCGSDDTNSEHDTDEPTYKNEKCYTCNAFWSTYHDLIGFGNLGMEIPHDDDAARLTMELLPDCIEIKNNISHITKWPEVILAVLRNKKALPALIGIDDIMDSLIQERLQNGD